jgi:hypothetical protein
MRQKRAKTEARLKSNDLVQARRVLELEFAKVKGKPSVTVNQNPSLVDAINYLRAVETVFVIAYDRIKTWDGIEPDDRLTTMFQQIISTGFLNQLKAFAKLLPAGDRARLLMAIAAVLDLSFSIAAKTTWHSPHLKKLMDNARTARARDARSNSLKRKTLQEILASRKACEVPFKVRAGEINEELVKRGMTAYSLSQLRRILTQ